MELEERASGPFEAVPEVIQRLSSSGDHED